MTTSEWTGREAPAGAEPGSAGGAEAGASRPVPAAGGRARRARRTRKRYSPEQKRATVEAFQQAGRSRVDFAALWGVSPATLANWLHIVEREGPQGFEPKPRRRRQHEDPRRLAPAVRREIARTKQRFPDFGLRKVRDFLARFAGIRVSTGSVRRTLREEGLAAPPPARRAKRRPNLPRRFERSRAGELWQSDITSYVLRRHSTRVYLVVFLDDFSRYVVSWALSTQQRGSLVCEALLEGIARFGKPQEVLTDQGRQYFAWRGKSEFQRLLAREGIRHVVSRTHHPQTLGKCERLWKTVGEELWERTSPEDLSGAKERLEHYFRHYNHFRPHQGIDGLVPADRFFGAQDALRRTLEAQMAESELALALEEAPRRPVFLFGQIGDRAVSLHGERGRLVIHTDGGGREELALGELGMAQTATTKTKETIDERARDEHGAPGREHDAELGVADTAAAPPASGPQARDLPPIPPARPFGAGIVADRERGGALAGAPAVHGDPGVLDGPRVEGADRGAPGPAAPARLAAQPAGALGDARGALAPAAEQGEARGQLRPSGERHLDPQAEDRGAGEEAGTHGGPGAGAEAPALAADGGREWTATHGPGEGEGTPTTQESAGPAIAGSGERSDACWPASDAEAS